MVKNLPAHAGYLGLIPGLGRALGGGKLTPLFLPGKAHGQRSLAGYSLCVHKELNMTERLTLLLVGTLSLYMCVCVCVCACVFPIVKVISSPK